MDVWVQIIPSSPSVKALVVNSLEPGFGPQAPSGGFKYSGGGGEYGQYGIGAFLETRAILEA